MFKQPKIGLKNFGEQIHHISLSFIFKGYVLCLLPAVFVSFQQAVKHQNLQGFKQNPRLKIYTSVSVMSLNSNGIISIYFKQNQAHQKALLKYISIKLNKLHKEVSYTWRRRYT